MYVCLHVSGLSSQYNSSNADRMRQNDGIPLEMSSFEIPADMKLTQAHTLHTQQ